jgi:DNA invertase Pin-like site-specific DNA recombinase
MIVDGDLGVSASAPGEREDFAQLLHRIQDGQVGIVFAIDVSRLARNSVDFSQLTHWCALYGVLVGDQSQVLDPAMPQDSLVLGIQGVLAVHELHTIRDRMQRGSDEKASRGELHLGIPRGYVVVDRKHLRMHPDGRVQRAIASVFEKFACCKSVSQLVNQLSDDDVRLPRAAVGGHGEQVEWVKVNYKSLLDMLQNPRYAGIYAYPRYKAETKTLAPGTLKKVVRLARPEEWQVVLHDHHPAYISAERYHANVEKIAMNAQRLARSGGAPRSGSSLLTGLITCRHCNHKMQVRYGRAGQVSYYCRDGRRQRESRGDVTAGCFRFAASALERQLCEQLLWAISPAGVAAAELASARLQAQRDSRRTQLVDELEHLRYEADLTRRRFDKVDPANRLVFDTLARELETCLQLVEGQESKLVAFDRDCPPSPTEEQRSRLNELGGCLAEMWHDPQTDNGLKKQVIRLLVEHVYAELDEATDEVVLIVKWYGGHHTTLRGPRRREAAIKQDQLSTIIDTLRKLYDDASIARVLNRSTIRCSDGKTWTKSRVRRYRKRHQIASYSLAEKESSGWLSQQEAATKLGISPMSVNRLIDRRILTAEGPPSLPRVLRSEDLASKEVQATIKRIKTHGNAPLPENPNQLSLLF